MTEEGDIPEDDDLLAAEYALGLLSEEENAEVESRLDGEPAFRARVVFWHEHFAAMTDTVREVEPPASLWRRIEARLPQADQSVQPAAPRQPLRPGRQDRRARPSRVGRVVAGLATAAALALAALLFLPQEEPDAPLFAGEVRAEDASLRLVVAYDPETGVLRLARAAGQAAPDRALQLWAIRQGENPVSLAVLPADERTELVVPEPLRPGFTEATLAVSDEPAGGSPTGQPTGPVVAVGEITRL